MNRIIKPGFTFMFIIGAWDRPNVRYKKELRELRICLGFILIVISAIDFTVWYRNLLQEYLRLTEPSYCPKCNDIVMTIHKLGGTICSKCRRIIK